MRETARERWNRTELERANSGTVPGAVSVGHPDLKADAQLLAAAAATVLVPIAPVVPDLVARLRLQQRQAALLDRLVKLGLAVSAAELPADDKGLLEMEQLAAEFEAGK